MQYAVGDQVFSSLGASVGHFCRAIAVPLLGVNPLDPSNLAWEQIMWPARLEGALAMGIWADWLRFDGQTDRSSRAELMLRGPSGELDRLLDVLVKQQGQFSPTWVNSR